MKKKAFQHLALTKFCATTNRIGCDFPECGRWSHESCLGLKVSSDLERQKYAFVWKSHDNTNGLDMFSDRVTASVSDIYMQVEAEELIEGSAATKTARRSGTSSTEQPLPPINVEYEGKFYHIANFLSLQQGKVYNPSTSRMARWMAVARNDFYERVETIVNPKKATNGLYLNDISAFWVPAIGVKCGQALRLLCKTSADMTVRLLKEVLDDLNITYRSSEKKADLIEKVRYARPTLHDASHDHNMRDHAFSSVWRLLYL